MHQNAIPEVFSEKDASWSSILELPFPCFGIANTVIFDWILGHSLHSGKIVLDIPTSFDKAFKNGDCAKFWGFLEQTVNRFVYNSVILCSAIYIYPAFLKDEGEAYITILCLCLTY
jgi:hypothetical protein